MLAFLVLLLVLFMLCGAKETYRIHHESKSKVRNYEKEFEVRHFQVTHELTHETTYLRVRHTLCLR